MNEIMDLPVVNFEAGGQVFPLTIHDAEGKRWVPSQQVASALGITNARKLIYGLIDKKELQEGKHYCSLKLQIDPCCNLKLQQVGKAQSRNYLVLSYRGIIRVSMRSDGVWAHLFRDWAEDVLYEVMMTGRYIAPNGGDRLYETTVDFHRSQAFFLSRENQLKNDMIATKEREVAALNLALNQQQALIAEKDRVNELLKANHALQEKQKQARTVVWARPQRRRHRPITEEVKQQIISLKRQGHTNGQIAKNMDRGRSTVSHILKEAGFPPGRPFYMQKASNPESSSSEVDHG